MSEDTIRFVRKSISPMRPPAPPQPPEELTALRLIASKLDELIDRPLPSPPSQIPAPIITVHTPPPAKPVRKWKFEIHRLSDSRTEIVAEAIE